MNGTVRAQSSECLRWFKSSYSGSEGGNCVEVAPSPREVFVRDSKHVPGPVIAATHAAWAAFVRFADGTP